MTTTTELANTTWCPGGAASFHTDFSDPGGSAASIARWALEWVYPLNAWLDGLVGNEAEVRRFATEWNAAGTELAAMTHDADAALRDISDMEGKSIRALREALRLVSETALDASEWSAAVAASLALASRIVTALHDAVAGALSELAGIIASLFDFSLSLSSLNPLDKIQKLRNLATHVDRFVHVIERLMDQMFDSLGELVRLIDALRPLMEEALAALRTLLSKIVDVAGFPVGFLGGGALGAVIGTIVGGPIGGILGSAVGAVAGGMVGDTAGGVLSDRLAADPRVTEIDASDLSGNEASAYEKAMQCRELGSLTDFVTQNGYTDGIGLTDRTMIDVKRVADADGNEHWVVSLPSTQDWNILKGFMGNGPWEDTLADYPAANDLDTNVALMLSDHPELATQYERAVYEAMNQAGIPEGAPVVYTGFSQGGIISGCLAADQNSPYTPIGIVTTGAPVDRFAIPDSVKVVSFAHASDPVAPIDTYMKEAAAVASAVTGSPLPLIAYGGNDEDTTIYLDDPTAVVNPQGGSSIPAAHSVEGYQQSVSEWEAAHPQEAASLVSLVGGTVIDHQTYAFTE